MASYPQVLSGGDRWSGAFQLYSSLTRYRDDLASSGSAAAVRMMERSVYSERICFLQSLKEAGGITDPEYLVAAKWFDLLTKVMATRVRPDLISNLIPMLGLNEVGAKLTFFLVYLRCDVDTLLERIRRRGRPEESGLGRPFLARLQRCHDDWLVHGNSTVPEAGSVAGVPVLVLDGSLPEEEFVEMVARRRDEILGRKL